MIIWIDTETTGLDPVNDHILEIACVITDWDLVEKDRWTATIRDPSAGNRLFESDFCMRMHSDSGLLSALVEPDFVSLRGACYSLDNWIAEQTPGLDMRPPLGGSSVHFDRSFLENTPGGDFVLRHCSHRNIDVSTIYQLAKGWGLPFEEAPCSYTHRALDDILWSIEQLRLLRSDVFSVPAL